MNDSRSSGHPVRPASPSRTTGRPPQSTNNPHRRTRRRRRRRFSRAVLIFLAMLSLISMLIGGILGFWAGRVSVKPTETHPSAELQSPAETRPPVDAQPPAASDPVPPPDTTAPRIMGVNKLSLFLGGTVAYRSGILLTDDTDPAPKLSVDSSQVDLSAPGTYPVVYIATDSAGNFSTAVTTVTVSEAPDTYVDEAIIRERADKLLAKILTEDMTPEQQVNAIYDYIEGHHYYIAKFDKTDYMQAAYLMMTENRGDCFGYYALSRLLFERLGLPNLSVTRMKNEVRTTSHYWNMVSLDGGNTWYHFDSTPHLTHPTRTCLITDADLEAFNQLMPNYYYFDHSSFPQTPAE